MLSIARQYDGDIISLKFEKTFLTEEEAKDYIKNLQKTFVETVQVPGVGPVEFFCERGVHELEVTQ